MEVSLRRWKNEGAMKALILFLGGIIMVGSGPRFSSGDGVGSRGSPSGPAFSLPQEIGQWQMEGDQNIYGPDNLFDYMDGAAELYLSYGFKSMRLCRYKKGEESRIVVEIYEMSSSEDAYGVFSLEREDEEAGVGQGSELGGGVLRFWKGRYFVNVYGEKEAKDDELLTIGRAVADSIRETGKEPELIKLLPDESKGLVPRSVRFFRTHICLNQRFFIANKNILLLDSTTSGIMAQVKTPQGKVQIIMVGYPAEEKAVAAERSFQLGFMPDAGEEKVVRTEDGKWTGAMRKGRLWIGVFGAWDKEQIQEIFRMILQREKE